jgi:hypothetical protein
MRVTYTWDTSPRPNSLIATLIPSETAQTANQKEERNWFQEKKISLPAEVYST